MRRILLCKTAAIKGVIKDLEEVVEDPDISLAEIDDVVKNSIKLIERICKL